MTAPGDLTHLPGGPAYQSVRYRGARRLDAPVVNLNWWRRQRAFQSDLTDEVHPARDALTRAAMQEEMRMLFQRIIELQARLTNWGRTSSDGGDDAA